VTAHLRVHFADAALNTILGFRSHPRRVGIEPARLLEFITVTLQAGLKVSPLTLRLDRWCDHFEFDVDGEHLCTSVAYGFDWEHDVPSRWYEVENRIPSEHWGKVDAKIREMSERGEIFATTRANVCGIAPLLAVDKNHSMMKSIRLVHDLSSPKGGSVNDAQVIPSRRFASVRDMMLLMRPKALLCKVDISNAYRAMALAPRFWHLHAFAWRGVVYSDARLVFGSSGAPACFDRFTQAFQRLTTAQGYACVGYMDDYMATAST
jgi:hypothetical protein